MDVLLTMCRPSLSPRRPEPINEVDPQALDTLGVRVLRAAASRRRRRVGWVRWCRGPLTALLGENPIGKAIRLSMGDPGSPALRRSTAAATRDRGVVADVTYRLHEREAGRRLRPLRSILAVRARDGGCTRSIAIRTTVEPLTLPAAGRGGQVDRGGRHDWTMDERVRTSPSVTNSRFFASLFTIFGSLAILLAMVGVYGVMSWVVGQRTGEFGIRMALGAGARDIIRMLLGQSLRPILVGLALGSLGGYGLSRALNSMFFRMTARSRSFVAMSLMLAVAWRRPGCPRGASPADRSRRCATVAASASPRRPPSSRTRRARSR
jgi:hypothetical protein